jgi:hypothetical protein
MNQRIVIDILGVTPEFMEYITDQLRRVEAYAETWGGMVITTITPLEAQDEQQIENA